MKDKAANREEAGHRQTPKSPEPEWTSARKRTVSTLVIFHLFCVIIAPLAVVEPRSNLAYDAFQLARPWTQSLFIGHGYRFFAPEPGPSHIVHYTVTNANGETIEGRFPDRNIWPRLLYHRWFMLSETIFQHVSDTLDPGQLAEWQQQVGDEIEQLRGTHPAAARQLEFRLQRELQQHAAIAGMRDQLVTRVGRMLLQRHDGVKVDLVMITRVIPPPEDIARGMRLDNQLYMPDELKFPLGTVHLDNDQLESIAPQSDADEPGRGDAGL